MSKIAFSFDVKGNYAAFMDPRTTSSGVTYYSPTHSAILGLLGAIWGVKRPTQNEIREGKIYGSEFLWFRDNVKAGIKVNHTPEKHVYYTNHVSFKENRTMPTKTEVLLSPDYTIYVAANENPGEKLLSNIQKKTFAYPIYFGRAYCKAVVHGKATTIPHKLANGKRFKTRCVVPHTVHTMHGIDPGTGKTITEHQTHHYAENGKMTSCIIPRTIPVNGERILVFLKCKPIGDVIELSDKGDCVVVF